MNNFRKEHLLHATGPLLDETRDMLDTTTEGRMPTGQRSDTLEVIAKHFPVVLGTTFIKTSPPGPRPDLIA